MKQTQYGVQQQLLLTLHLTELRIQFLLRYLLICQSSIKYYLTVKQNVEEIHDISSMHFVTIFNTVVIRHQFKLQECILRML